MSDEHAGELRPAPPAGIRYRATEVAAFSNFYRQYTPKIVAFLLAQGATLTDATEVTQYAMLEAWQNWTSIQHPQAWVRKVAGRALVRRFSSLEVPVLELDERTALVPDDLQIAAWERRHDILRALQLLPSRQRQVMAWTLAEYTPAEIAEILRITPEAVRSNLRKARRSIAINLKSSQSEER